ncbi:MAG: DUF2997 domain-containing protein [Microcystis sp. M048S1]|jgi:hypothetical protein|uniref:DUF2997 domain-containing protein n=2 Tax=Microcystis TaxID=1125 RepID=A0A841URH0_MICAE|nr:MULTISPECIES: DUF2997 domain-containing protein [Microcystis]MCA2901215.1 DUF2997 domain-containing protein [Microcystis sp. M035S1]MCZ8126687.1 DUF2997 domain-containing protein [Microcystis sp. LE19-114.1B]MBC1190736.1 DUF2997 domain-containing protein [Microcystis aeruginosa BLCC-F108]MBD2624372.1 DUF2997 domain-containing protein [Microcystis flos-aquae FACHB-1344]MBE9072516.1 DUF2997 domain-containing protein [Microcystis sp. LEGE 08355]
MSKKIQLRIFPDGRVQAEVQGIKGKACTDYIEILEEVLNAEVYESSYTPEYYENQEVWLSQQIDETVQDRS